MKYRIIFFTIALIISSSCFAFFCPTNFSQIDFGNSIDQVKQLCGGPDKETSVAKEPKTPQEWTYFIPQTVSATNTANQMQGTLKTSITFDKDGNAINISVNGIGVGASTICGNNIQLGDSQESIKTACGKPGFINKQEAENASDQQKIKVTELLYNGNPPVILVFENGVLKEKK